MTKAAGSRFAAACSLVIGAGLALGAVAAASKLDSALELFGHGADSAEPALALSAKEDRLAALRAFEAERRARADFETLGDSGRTLGADPYAVEPVSEGRMFAGILRGRSALVLLDRDARELVRVAAPESPTGLAVRDQRIVYVVGELSPEIARYRVEGSQLIADGNIPVRGVSGLRDLAVAGDWLYAVDERDGRLITIQDRPGSVQRELEVGRGAFRVRKKGGFVLVDCLLDHALVAYRLLPSGLVDAGSRQAIVHDGPIWSFDALDTKSEMILAAGGVENHPLDRRNGSFGFIDSFLFVYRLSAGQKPERLLELNLSELEVVVPKAIGFRPGNPPELDVTGFAGQKRARLRFSRGFGAPPDVETEPARPGTNALGRGTDREIFANPLFDAWVVEQAGESKLVPVPDAGAAPRSAELRVGEALAFTTLMAPNNRSTGALSRFSCETCHFEGGVDGRTHHTGRGAVHATTKPLLGLFNNRPYFSRALDPDLAKMVNNEFRVAGAGSGQDPWFSLETRRFGWLRELGVDERELGPERLRRSLMEFLMAFSHRPNSKSHEKSRLTSDERAGAELFRERCESCHAARLVSDEPATRVPFERWEALILSANAPIVWARAERERTGVEPYVHPNGARVPSLRRLYKKRPYFTNGSAADLEALLRSVRFTPARFYHQQPPADATLGLDAEQRAKLHAFLDLL